MSCFIWLLNTGLTVFSFDVACLLYSSRENEVENQLKQISQLKKYIGESENIPRPADVAKREKEAMLAKLKVYLQGSDALYWQFYKMGHKLLLSEDAKQCK